MKKILLVILFSYFTFFFFVFLLSILPPFYKYEFQIRGVYENFRVENIEREVVDMKAGEVISYMHGFRKGLDPDFFSGEDIIHMRDVRNLFLKFDIFFLSSIISLFLFVKEIFRNKEIMELAKILSSSGILLLIFSLLIVIFAVFDFDNSFITFHKIFFRDEFWMLDPDSSNLIKFFPAEFFRDFILITIVLTLVVSLFLVSFSILMKRKKNFKSG